MSERAAIFKLRVGAVASIIEACWLDNRRFQLRGLYRRHLVRKLWASLLAGKYDESARRDSLGSSPNRIVLSVDVSHELGDCFVRRELHSDFHRHARICNLSGGAVSDSMRPHVWHLCSLEDARPAP